MNDYEENQVKMVDYLKEQLPNENPTDVEKLAITLNDLYHSIIDASDLQTFLIDSINNGDISIEEVNRVPNTILFDSLNNKDTDIISNHSLNNEEVISALVDIRTILDDSIDYIGEKNLVNLMSFNDIAKSLNTLENAYNNTDIDNVDKFLDQIKENDFVEIKLFLKDVGEHNNLSDITQGLTKHINVAEGFLEYQELKEVSHNISLLGDNSEEFYFEILDKLDNAQYDDIKSFLADVRTTSLENHDWQQLNNVQKLSSKVDLIEFKNFLNTHDLTDEQLMDIADDITKNGKHYDDMEYENDIENDNDIEYDDEEWEVDEQEYDNGDWDWDNVDWDNVDDELVADTRTVADTSYSIIDSEIVDNTEIALGENTNGHFATWTRNIEVDNDKGGENWHTGNYFMGDKESAIQNFQERINNEKPRDTFTLDDIRNNPELVVSILEENADIRDKLNRISEIANFSENLDVKQPFEQLQQVSDICLDAYFHSDNSVSMNNILDFVAEGFNEGVINLDNLAQMNKYELIDFALNDNLEGVSEQYPIEDLSHLQEYEIDAINQIKSGVSLGKLDSNLSSNWNVVMVAVENNGDDLKFAHFKLQEDFDIVKTAVENTGSALNYADEELQNNIEIVEIALLDDEENIKYVGDDLLNDRDFMETVIEQNPFAIEYIGQDLKEDFALNLLAIEQNINAFNSIDENLCTNESFMLKAIESDTESIEYADYDLLDNSEFMLKVVEIDYSLVQNANEDLLDDFDFMKSAFEIDTDTFEYASDEVKNEIANDSQFLLDTLKEQHSAIIYASDELKNDRDFLKDAISVNPECFKKLVNDNYITKGANHENPIDNDRDLVELAVKGFGLMLSVASDELKNDKDLVLTAISNYPFALRDVSYELKGDPEVILCAIEKSDSKLLFDYASQDIQAKFEGKDKDEIIDGLKQLVNAQKSKERPSVKEKINANKEIIAKQQNKTNDKDKNLDKKPDKDDR